MKQEKFQPVIELNRNSATPLNEQIAENLRNQIVRNRLPARTAMISERTLAEQLGVNRNTIHQAYLQLIGEGLLTTGSAPNSAIRIAPGAPEIYRTPFPSINLVLPFRFKENLRFFGPRSIEIIAGIMDRAADLEISVNVLNLPAPETPREKIVRWLDNFVNRSIGIISLGNRVGVDPVFEMLLKDRRLPHVFLSGTSHLAHISSVEPEVGGAMKEMFTTAYRLGHRRAVILRRAFSDLYFRNSAETRSDSMIAAAHDAQIDSRVIELPSSISKSEELLSLMKSPDAPTLIAAYNDLMAENVIAQLTSCGISVPEDVSVTGYDRISGKYPIAGIDNPSAEMGEIAVDIIHELFEHARVGDALHRRADSVFYMDRTLGPARRS